MKTKHILAALAIMIAGLKVGYAADTKAMTGTVNFMTVITDSKYGKSEQEQLENIKKQWTKLIEETDKELQDVSTKLEDQDYLDGLSPEAEDELKAKKQNLLQDISKYQNQLYQILNQANYFFIQKMSQNISKASEKVAQDKKLDVILNKEACFYSNPKIDITTLVITEMDKNFESDSSKNEASMNDASKNDAVKNEVSKNDASKSEAAKNEISKNEKDKNSIVNPSEENKVEKEAK